MPADPTPDLAALDALYQAATPGEWRQGTRIPSGIIAGRESVGDLLRPADAALIAALHNAWPALRRRLEIGDAAVEVIEAYDRYVKAQNAVEAVDWEWDQPPYDELQDAGDALDAARRRYEETCRAAG